MKKHIVLPFAQFLRRERSAGIVLAFFVLLALVIANSPLRENYTHFLEHRFGFVIDGTAVLYFSVEHWINDGLMSMFFFVVGLELKRELIGGELRSPRKVILPVMAAVMGALFPAVIYLLFNFGTPEAHGWGVPMATDIAFALAVLYLLGDRIPMSAKVFLTTLAIVDDLVSVLVIALFYTSHISVLNLTIGMLFLGVMFLGNRWGIKNVWFYGLLGIGGVWISFLTSGIHATISAVLAAMVIPADAGIPESTFTARIKKLTRQFERAVPNDVRTLEPAQVEILSQVRIESQKAIPPLQRLEHGLHPFVSFVIMPIFALANAGVSFVDMDLSSLGSNNIALGVALGLLLGKPLGIVSSVWLSEKMGLARRSRSLSWRTVWGVGFLAAIGFTMSMFVTMLAFDDSAHYVQAKIGIFVASLLGGFVGYRLLKRR